MSGLRRLQPAGMRKKRPFRDAMWTPRIYDFSVLIPPVPERACCAIAMRKQRLTSSPASSKNSAVTENPTLHRVFIGGIPD
jgi:hypothetical protein